MNVPKLTPVTCMPTVAECITRLLLREGRVEWDRATPLLVSVCSCHRTGSCRCIMSPQGTEIIFLFSFFFLKLPSLREYRVTVDMPAATAQHTQAKLTCLFTWTFSKSKSESCWLHLYCLPKRFHPFFVLALKRIQLFGLLLC